VFFFAWPDSVPLLLVAYLLFCRVCAVLNSEVSERLQEVNDVKAALAEAQSSLQKKEADIARIHKMVSAHMSVVLSTLPHCTVIVSGNLYKNTCFAV
jgi:hypothetical protein